ncbi:MAG: copper resistance protein CopC [Caulobacteraceae bacterium]
MKTIAALALTLALGFTAEASAHAKLVKSDPPANGEAKDKSNIALTFNEEISGKLSGATVKDSSGAVLASTTMVDQKGKGLMVMLKAPLKAGDYTLDWHAVASDDGHRTNGALAFSAK